MFDYVKLIKVAGSEAGKETEVTRQAYEKNKLGIYKDWQIKDEPVENKANPKPESPQNPVGAAAEGKEPTVKVENNTQTVEQNGDFDGYTVKQLRQYADDNGIEYKMPINKADLLQLIENHTTKK